MTQLCGIGASTVMTLLSTVGTDVEAWSTDKHFVSWLALAPVNQVSAGRNKNSKTKRSANPLRNALAGAAMTVQWTDSFLGENHRRLKSRVGPGVAKIAIARKLAAIIYHILKNDIRTIRYDAEFYRQKRQERELKNLRRKAGRMGYALTLVSA